MTQLDEILQKFQEDVGVAVSDAIYAKSVDGLPRLSTKLDRSRKRADKEIRVLVRKMVRRQIDEVDHL